MSSNDKKLFLLDGFALIYRAYFAFINNPRINSKGLNTSAMFGFTNLLYDVLRKHKPTHLAVVFDPKDDGGEREVLYEDYKAHRESMPEDLQLSIPYIERIIKAFNIPLLVMEGYEADDLVGTLAKKAEKAGFKTYMMTSDKDYGQLVSENIFWYKPGRLGAPDEILGIPEVCKKFDVAYPEQVIDLLGLMGDSADNIPGIPGVGEKTAVKLLKEFGTVENLLANTDKLTGKMKEKVEQNKELATISKTLATIILDVPIELDEEDLKVEEWNKEALKEIFGELEFRTLSERLLGESIQVVTKTIVNGQQGDLFATYTSSDAIRKIEDENESKELVNLKTIKDVEHQYFLVDDKNWRKELITEMLLQKEISLDTETTDIDPQIADIVGISFCFRKNQAYYIPLPSDFEEAKLILHEFKSIFESNTILKIGQNIKYDMQVLAKYDCHITLPIFDTMLAHYMFQPEQKHGMDFLAETFLNYKPIATEQLIGPKGKNQKSMRDIPIEKVAEYCNEDTDVTFQFKQVFAPEIIKSKTENVFENIDTPLIPILCKMEREGVNINTDFLKSYSLELQENLAQTENKIYNLAGENFNIGSPKQLGEILFEKMKLDPKAKKTKTGQYATGEDVLKKLASKSEIVSEILEYREISKLKSTYVDTLPELINPSSKRVHTSYMQTVAVTGRLSSQNPNLQNIPVRTDRGKEIRKAFIARTSDHILVSADYSQIELRIVAAMSGDESMCNAFKNNVDIHIATAAKVFGVAEKDVTKEMRYKAKSVNFGIIYGQGQFGLAENLGISRTEAKDLIQNYWKQYLTIKDFMDYQIAFARENGYVQTLSGRKRWLSDINSANFTVRAFAERNAINMPIQGTAADMIKLAMIKIDQAFKEKNIKSKMILQVHDELIFDVEKSELDVIKPIILESMQSAMQLPNSVPTIAEIGYGDNWLEAH